MSAGDRCVAVGAALVAVIAAVLFLPIDDGGSGAPVTVRETTGTTVPSNERSVTEWPEGIGSSDDAVSVSRSKGHSVTERTDSTSEVVEEDDPRWDCRTMGNQACGVQVMGKWYVVQFEDGVPVSVRER